MTNLEKWQLYTKHLFSAQNFIDTGWLFTVNAALQRRVWYGNRDNWGLFGNLYVVLIGPPASGKTLTIDAVKGLLTHHKNIPTDLNDIEQRLKEKQLNTEDMLLFPDGPNDSSYEAIVNRMSSCIQHHRFKDINGKERVYVHSSMAFVLSELASLFKRREDKIPKFLLQTYDCEDYRYETMKRGKDIVKKSCLSLLAGCVPEFLVEAEKHNIFSDGFVSRTLFVYEQQGRTRGFHLPEASLDQLQAKNDLLDWLLRLSKLYGPVTYSQEVFNFLEDWYKKVHEETTKTANRKMATYFGRKCVHIQKLALAYHFSDDLSLELTLKDFQKAIDLLGRLEAGMQVCFSCGGRNELNHMTMEVYRYIKSSRQELSYVSLLAEFGNDINRMELDEILIQLQLFGKIKKNQVTDKFHSI